MPFRDRVDAGRQLARLLERYRGAPDVVVLGLARGGIPVAEEVARALNAPLDVMVARKIGAPGQPEFGIGAVAPGGVRIVNERSARYAGATDADVERTAVNEVAEMERRLLAYRGDPRPPSVAGRTVILVDDGLATGVSARAAVRSLRAQGPARLILAVPVAAPDSLASLAAEVDEAVAVETPELFQAVGLWYDDFSQTSDEEVRLALARGQRGAVSEPVRLTTDGVTIDGDLSLPTGARALVIFAHGSGSSRFSPRNQHVAKTMRDAGLGTLLLDLLTPDEETIDERTRHIRFDIDLLARRVAGAVRWARGRQETAMLPIGLFGSSTGGAAALIGAAEAPEDVAAVVSRGGRPDLADARLPDVRAATLLIVGGADDVVLELNEMAYARLRCEKRLHVVPGATHLFEEPGALDEVARAAAEWFVRHAEPPRREKRVGAW